MLVTGLIIWLLTGLVVLAYARVLFSIVFGYVGFFRTRWLALALVTTIFFWPLGHLPAFLLAKHLQKNQHK